MKDIVILGAGNVGTHLGKAFHEAGMPVVQVYNRTLGPANSLAELLGCACTDNLEDLTGKASLYVITVTDDAIGEVAARFPFRDRMLVHTSGTTNMHVLKSGSAQYGVFYPLQTFSKEIPVDFRRVPLCLEASDTSCRDLLEDIAGKLTGRVIWIDSEKRRFIHVAAVFACNFVNHMYHLAEEILREHDLPFDLLHPLIEETARKAMTDKPGNVQTGPARRNNQEVIRAHLGMLSAMPAFKELYGQISDSIRKKYASD